MIDGECGDGVAKLMQQESERHAVGATGEGDCKRSCQLSVVSCQWDTGKNIGKMCEQCVMRRLFFLTTDD